jgi:hypothetical protein
MGIEKTRIESALADDAGSQITQGGGGKIVAKRLNQEGETLHLPSKHQTFSLSDKEKATL